MTELVDDVFFGRLTGHIQELGASEVEQSAGVYFVDYDQKRKVLEPLQARMEVWGKENGMVFAWTDSYQSATISWIARTEGPYPRELLSQDDDDGTMVMSLKDLEEAVVGHKIVQVRHATAKLPGGWRPVSGLALLLDNGSIVFAEEQGDCCAYTDIKEESILKNMDQIEHVITGVGTEEGFTTWHIYAEMGDVLSFEVGWSGGNLGYYAFGFNVQVFTPDQMELVEEFKAITA